MLSDAGFRVIAEMLNVDVPGYYSYKSDGKLVMFFNSNFGFTDVYRSGFPSRWLYAMDKIKLLWNQGRFDNFLNLIFSKRFIMVDNGLNEVQALGKIGKIVVYLNEQLSVEGYKIHRMGQEYKLVSEDGDLEFIGEYGFINVYMSRSTRLIIKKLKDDFKTLKGVRHRFKREFELTSNLQV